MLGSSIAEVYTFVLGSRLSSPTYFSIFCLFYLFYFDQKYYRLRCMPAYCSRDAYACIPRKKQYPNESNPWVCAISYLGVRLGWIGVRMFLTGGGVRY